MRILKFVVPLFCVLSLSACSSTWEGLKRDLHDNTTVEPGQPPRPVEFELPKAPKGYSGQNRRGLVLKPPGAVGTGIARADQNGLVWHDMGESYDMASAGPATSVDMDFAPLTEMLAAQPVAEVSLQSGGEVEGASGAVTVYPLEGAISDSSGGYTPPQYAAVPGLYGPALARVFFAHGSASIKKSDKARLNKIARRTKKDHGDVSVTVVGHASKRVDGVTDPIKRRMINFAMAQKRADAVMRELTRAGLRPGWVQAISHGDEDPNPAPQDMPQEVADRRAEVYMDER